MITIGRYFVFVVLMTGTILCAHNFSESDKQQFLNKILKLHNKYRAKHRVKELKLDAESSESADTILNMLINKEEVKLPEDKGVNMAFAELKNNSKLDDNEAKELFLQWYDKGVGWDFENEPSDEKAKDGAPFTQILWRETTLLGLAIAVNENGYYDVVATYYPRGNQKLQYKNNVFKRIDLTCFGF